MKKLCLVLTGILFFGVLSLYAQTGQTRYNSYDPEIRYNGKDYTFFAWQEKRYTIKKQYIVTGDSWVHAQARVWLYGESRWTNWDKLGDPVPVPIGYNTYSLQQEILNLPNYQLDSSGALLRNTNANNEKEVWSDGNYIYILTYVYKPK